MKEAFRDALDLEDWGLRLASPATKVKTLFKRYQHESGEASDRPLRASEWWKGKQEGRQQSMFATTFAWGILGKEKGESFKREDLSHERVEKFFRERYPYLSLESRQLILEPAIAKAALEAADDAGLRAAPTLVYLCKISAGQKKVTGIIAALDPTQTPPLGPFLPPGKTELADDEIALVDWTLQPTLLPLSPGAEVTLLYKPPEHQPEKLDNRTATFRFAGVVPLKGAADDPDLTPPFPGMTDKELLSSWKLPFQDNKEWNKDAVRLQYGTLYWSEQRTTPKAYITLAAGKKLWASRFGDLTSIRLAPREGTDLDGAAQRFRAALRKRLDPDDGGLALMSVKEDALKASVGGTDFAGLFLGFSFFLIAAALLLVGLLFRLNLDRRGAEVGILLATGYRHAAVRRLLLMEGTVLAVLGAAAGLGVAIGYAAVLIRWLGAVWPGGTLRSFLQPHVTGMSLAMGFGASFLVSLLTILWAVRGLGKVAPSAPAGRPDDVRRHGTERETDLGLEDRGDRQHGCRRAADGRSVRSGSRGEGRHLLRRGALLLTAALAALSAWMRKRRHANVDGGSFGVERLGVRNAARNPTRSMLTAGLLASAAFLIVAVEAFRRSADASTVGSNIPSGGFALIAESDLPVFQDLNSPKGRDEMRSKLVAHYRQQNDRDAERRADEEMSQLERVRIVSLRVRAGDDASCLNLYQPRQPRIFSVPTELIERGGFAFASRPADGWKALERPGEPFAAFGEQNTVVWMLKSGLGKTLEVPDENGTKRALRIDGLLAGQRLSERTAGVGGELPEAVSQSCGIQFLPDRNAAGEGDRGQDGAGNRPRRPRFRGDADGPEARSVPGRREYVSFDVSGARRPGTAARFARAGGGAAARRLGAAGGAGPAAGAGLSARHARPAGAGGERLPVAGRSGGGHGVGAAGGRSACAGWSRQRTVARPGGAAGVGPAGGAAGRSARRGRDSASAVDSGVAARVTEGVAIWMRVGGWTSPLISKRSD